MQENSHRLLTVKFLPVFALGILLLSVTFTSAYALADHDTAIFRIEPVNDAPAFTMGQKVSCAEDARLVTVDGWATGVIAGPANEFGQTMNFELTTDDPVFFFQQPSVDISTGDLTFSPAANAFGDVSITVILRDNGGTAHSGIDSTQPQTFTITITPVNDPPVIQPVADRVIDEGSELSFAVEAGDIDGTVPSLVAQNLPMGAVFIDSGNGNGGFFWTPEFDKSGIWNLTFTADDGLLSDSDPMTITVNDAAKGSISLTGVSSETGVYLYASSGWYGEKVRDGSGVIADIDPGNYLMSIAEIGKRRECVPVTVGANQSSDIAVGLRASVAVQLETPTALQSNGLPLNAGQFISAAMGDFDKDDDLDLMFGKNSGIVDYYENADDNCILEQSFDLGTTGLQCIRIGDMNNDNRLDIIAGWSTGAIAYYPGGAGFTFGASIGLYSAATGLSGFDLLDFDNDNNPDYVLGYTDGTIEIAQSLNGTFVPQLAGGGNITVASYAAPLAIDSDGDTDDDLCVADGSGNVTLFVQGHDGTFRSAGGVNAGGQPLVCSGRGAISSVYGPVNEFISLLLADNSGAAVKAAGSLRGDFVVDGNNRIDSYDLDAFGDAWETSETDGNWN
ncbi:MAG: hypothetical protein GF401_10245 [Chitinivibrionales bacterium]|nr:hypothetical protein [Chitinivibrionales bacterium]